ncbi:MAG: PQQ-binding-like beta-propeller repeat protein [Acidobacteriota bacterium]
MTPASVFATPLPPLPEGIASFGGAVAGDTLYVYGGHVGTTHQHSIENLSHRFSSLDLAAPERGWQSIGEVKGLQGLPMVAHGRRVCRVGGLNAHNHKGDDEDLHSIADLACFDPDSGAWQELPSLPQPRSSHDAAVLGDELYVIGGWQLRGKDNDPLWHDSMAVIDLSASKPVWKTIPQPFQRRALAVAAAGARVYAFGGLGSDGTSRQVDIYDTETERWIAGPELPEMAARLKGFGVSAFGVGDRVYLSGADGIVHALVDGHESWQERLGKLETPRFFHRLLPHRDRLLFVAGAARSGHLTSLESLPISELIPGSVPLENKVARVDRGNWPGFRGHGDSRVKSAEVPLRWSEQENLAWRTKLPGYGQSAPIVWGRQAFVTSVEGPMKEELILTALDLESGEIRWRRRFAASQKAESSDMVSRGAPTPAVDGERIYAFWESGDLIALDHLGATLWQRSLTKEYGDFAGNHGVASSPVLTDSDIIIQVTHAGPSYFLAANKATGETHWKVDRPENVAWTTPVVVDGPNGDMIISSAAGRVEAFAAADGKQLWAMDGIEKNHVPSITVDGDLMIVPSSEPGQSFALRRKGDGPLTKEHIAWHAEGITSGFGSPVAQGGCVLFTNKAGVVTCLDQATGEKRWTHRLPDSVWASPIAAGERVFFFTKEGKTAVLEPNVEAPGMLAENPLQITGTVYGAAAVRGAFLIRSGNEIVRVGNDSASSESRRATSATARKEAEQVAER